MRPNKTILLSLCLFLKHFRHQKRKQLKPHFCLQVKNIDQTPAKKQKYVGIQMYLLLLVIEFIFVIRLTLNSLSCNLLPLVLVLVLVLSHPSCYYYIEILCSLSLSA